jgi:hypothetical protein
MGVGGEVSLSPLVDGVGVGRSGGSGVRRNRRGEGGKGKGGCEDGREGGSSGELHLGKIRLSVVEEVREIDVGGRLRARDRSEGELGLD